MVTQGLVRRSLASLGALVILGTNTIAVTAVELPIVQSVALGMSGNLPWSQPVKVVDPFEGTFLKSWGSLIRC
jgi:hypothetical protein